MFGKPCPRPPYKSLAIILPWVWTYLFKINPMTLDDDEKSRGTCNGGPHNGKVITIAETYAACVEQPIHRLMWAIMASINYIGLGADVSNAFAEAPPLKTLSSWKLTPNSSTGGSIASAIHPSPKDGSFPSFVIFKDTLKLPVCGISISTAFF